MNGTILVVGASGHFAGTLVPALAARGALLRGMVRNRDEIPRVRAAGTEEVGCLNAL
jgi:uncharacterized protein YbjT (DUF2867 family)